MTVFDRDLATGELTESFTATNGVDGVSGMDGPFSLALDLQSQTACAGTATDTLAVFAIGVLRDDFESGDSGGWQRNARIWTGGTHIGAARWSRLRRSASTPTPRTAWLARRCDNAGPALTPPFVIVR